MSCGLKIKIERKYIAADSIGLELKCSRVKKIYLFFSYNKNSRSKHFRVGTVA